MNKKFSSEFIEKEFLLLCSPSELLEYFDNISKQIIQRENPFSTTKISENIENALYNKNDKKVDFALATICNDKTLEKILERNNDDPKILSAALTNKIAVNGFFSAPKWLQSRFESIIKSGIDEQIINLFSNISLPSEIVEQTLLRENVTKEISDKEYLQIIWHLLHNSCISKEPEDRYDYDLSQHKIIQACWNLLLILPVNLGTASVLQQMITNFQEIEIPYSFSEKLNIEESDWSKKSLNQQQEFLKIVFDRWVQSNDDSDSSWNYFNELRKLIVTKIDSYYLLRHENFLLSRNDSSITQGFFSSIKENNFSEIDEKSIKKYFEKYGRDFLIGLIYGDQIYLKSNRKVGKIISDLISNFKDDEVIDNYETIHSQNKMRFNYLKNSKESDKFINDIYDFDDDTKNHHDDSIESINISITKLREKISNSENLTTTIVREDIQLLSKQIELLNLKFDSISQNSDSIYNKLTNFSSSIVKNIDNIKETTRWVAIVVVITLIYIFFR